MPLLVKHSLAEPVEGTWYLTTASVVSSGDGRVSGPGRDRAYDSSGSWSVLGRSGASEEIGLEADYEQVITADNLTCKAWPGHHLVASGSGATIVAERYRTAAQVHQNQAVDTAAFQQWSSLTLVAAVKRTAASFAGRAPLLSLGGTGMLVRFLALAEDGSLLCDGYRNNAAAAGRSCPAGTLDDEEVAIFIVRVSSAGWTIHKNGEQVDTANVGTGAGQVPSSWSPWSSASILVGGSDGDMDFRRVMLAGGLSLNQSLKLGTRLNLELSIY